MTNLDNYRKDVIEACEKLVRSGIMTRSHHGNASLRLPGGDKFLLTAGGSLANMQPESITLFDLDGQLIEGTILPVGAEIIQMHAIVYRTRDGIGGVVHTHSPFATGFAVASQAIPAAYEAMVRAEMTTGVPVAKYGPRGSQQSVDNIEAVLKQNDGLRAMLLENHGVLTFAESLARAVNTNFVLEESAEIILNAARLGGAKPIPPEMIEATRSRAASFQAAGALSREGKDAR